jgi:GNAT superfamily N-acetyltransferase
MDKANQTVIEKNITEEIIREIMATESGVFHDSLAWEEDELRRSLFEPSAVTVIAYDEDGRIAGYLMAMDFSQEIDELRADADPEIEDISDALYINNIVIRPDAQGKGYFGKLVKKILETFPERAISLHASTANNCSAGMQKYGARFIRRVEDWYGSGEPFDYLIFEPKK